MPARPKPETVPVAKLPAFLRSLRDVEPVALALDAQAQLTYAQADALAESGASPIVETAVRTQALELTEASTGVREFAKRLAHADSDGAS